MAKVRTENSVRLQSPSCRQIVAARVALNWSQKDLSRIAGVGITSVRRLEALGPEEEPMDHLRPATVRRIVQALERAGVTFQYDNEVERLGLSFFRIPIPPEQF